MQLASVSAAARQRPLAYGRLLAEDLAALDQVHAADRWPRDGSVRAAPACGEPATTGGPGPACAADARPG